MNYCIVESRLCTPSYRWPIVFSGSLDQCRLALSRQGEPINDNTWRTDDGFRYTRGADLVERHICRAWWAEPSRVVVT